MISESRDKRTKLDLPRLYHYFWVYIDENYVFQEYFCNYQIGLAVDVLCSLLVH